MGDDLEFSSQLGRSNFKNGVWGGYVIVWLGGSVFAVGNCCWWYKSESVPVLVA